MSYEISEEIKKRLQKADQIGSNLDERCSSLLVFFSVHYNQNPMEMYGFNELYRRLGELKKKEAMKTVFTRQTLSVHLKHLLEQDLIEVREEKESNLKIKPRKYRLSKFWTELTKDLRPLYISSYEEVLKDFKLSATEPLTLLLLRAYLKLCVEIFRNALAIPEIYGTDYRYHAYNFIENLTKVYRTTVFERNEPETALRIIEGFRDFVNEKLNEKYGSL
jgi:DNA-binding transcriptional ArsR family regulator